VRVLLDEQLPRRLARELVGHDVSTVRQQGWAGVKNGELLRRAADRGFEVLLTADRSLPFQQNLAGARLGVVVFNCSEYRA
jgi:predicted nuclease of predicted toxin-antitoxin system